MLQKPGKGISFAVILWVVGFVWGSVVFMTPSLKAAPSIPFVSTNPWISFPIVLAWLPLAYFLARNYLGTTSDAAAEGVKLGLVFAITNALLDLLVLVVFLGTGFRFYASLSVIVGYAILLLVPRWVGRSVEKEAHR